MNLREVSIILRETPSTYRLKLANALDSMAEQAEREAATAKRKAEQAADPNSSESQARAQRDSIVAMVANLEPALCEVCDQWHRPTEGKDECDAVEDHERHDSQTEAEDAARETIEQDALSVEVRSDWHAPSSDPSTSTDGEYRILLCTGGPAVRLIGELENGQPTSVRLEYQDWGTPWTEFRDTSTEDDDALLAYAQQFYFGEG